ncbi:MAG: Asp-tRNA(Asn)/Glu-tRNA(Gln) amidotransferase subunit GatA [Ruminococcus sp.]|nr:Asp-tRNA(Asn)/Glu-tRNA(Gln) amidotransferase subunit GatA [Ruminococcus sp.]
MELYDYKAFDLSEMLKSKQISSLELVTAYIERINSVDKTLNAFITKCFDDALAQALITDKKRMDSEDLSMLAGIPIAIKDNISVRGYKMTCGSKMLENYVAPYDAAVIDKLRHNDSIIIGKMNMDEFAMGSSNQTSYFGACCNPYDITKVSGGSSGGCAAAVSSGEAAFALGSDTGGSIRQPSAFCGTVGFKPTYGTVSRYGLTAFASSLEQIGTVCGCVKDTAMLFDLISGKDSRDLTSVDKQYNCNDNLSGDIKGMKIGVPWELFESISQPDIIDSFKRSVNLLKDSGAQIIDITIDNTKLALAAYYVISSAEASSNLGRFDGVRYGYRADDCKAINNIFVKSRTQGFGDECKRRIMLGTFVLSAGFYDDYYKKAVAASKMIKNNLNKLFEQVDIIALPTSPETAFAMGDKLDDPVKMYQSDLFTVYANLTGIPAISVPCGIDKNGLPIGLQLMSDSFCENDLLNAAFSFESAFGGIPKPKL